jgi:small-conductance mechanosensitive channel
MRTALVRLLRLLLILLIIGPWGGKAYAADAASSVSRTAGTLPAGHPREAIAGMSDEQVRALLIDRLEAEAAQAASAVQVDMGFVVDDAQTIRYRLGETVAAVPDLPHAFVFILGELTRQSDSTKLLTGLVAILAAATSAEWLFRGMLRRFRRELGTSAPRTELGRLGVLIIHALIQALALGVFVVTAIPIFFVFHPDQELLRQAFWGILITILATRAVAIIGRLLLAPDRPRLRLPALSNDDAASLYRWLLALTAVVASAATFAQLVTYTKLPEPLQLAFGTLLQWLVIAALLAGILLQRRPLERWFAGRGSMPQTSIASLFARHWTILVGVGLIGMGMLATTLRLLTVHSQTLPIILSLLVMAVVPALDGLLRILVRHLLSSPEEPAPQDKNGSAAVAAANRSCREEATDSDYAPVIMRNLRIILAVLVIVTLGAIWNIDIERVAAGSLGSRVADALFTILIAVLLASALWGAIRTAIERHAPDEMLDGAAVADGEGGHGGLSRLQTLLPVVRKFLFATILVIVGMTVISALGVDIGPLLAGAGVVGIAIGFGAQALVRDIFSGVFFLIDDAFRVGEYIDVGSAKGTVERISIRSLRLRHHLGQINTVPFGEIKTVTNFSRDWVIMKLELRVPLDTDIEKVRKLVKQVGQQMQQDEEFGPNLLLPPKSQGVHRMEPTAYVVRVKFMAKPGEQFVLRRELFKRLHDAFREQGIRLGVSPIFVGATESSSTTAGATSAAAAASMIHEQQLPSGGATSRA